MRLIHSFLHLVSLSIWVLPSIAEDPAAKTVNCSALAGVLRIRGYDVGSALAELCSIWPADKPFPVETVHEAEDILNATFKQGGIYDMVTNLLKERNHSGKFCWRHNHARPITQPTGYSCPARLNDQPAIESPNQVQPQQASDGHFYCAKNCSDVCGNYVNRGEVQPGICGCRSQHPEDVGTAGHIFIYKELHRVILAQPEGCDMVQNEICYGTCPKATAPAFFVGNFWAVCDDDCANTSRRFACGFGCATGLDVCAQTVIDQVGEVVRTLGDAVGFLTGQPELVTVVDAVVSTAEFGVTALAKIVKAAITAWFTLEQQKQTVGLVAALVQFYKEAKKEVMKDRAMWATFVRLVHDMIEAVKSFHGWHGHSNVKEMADVILRHGAQELSQAYALMKAFTWPTCEHSQSLSFLPDVGKLPAHSEDVVATIVI